MKKRIISILIIVVIIALIILILSKVKFENKKRINEQIAQEIENIEYDMRIIKSSSELGGYAQIYEYILINIENKKGYYIYDYSTGENEHNYEPIEEINLIDGEIQKLIEYWNLSETNSELSDMILGDGYIIFYQGKRTAIPRENYTTQIQALDKLFDMKSF